MVNISTRFFFKRKYYYMLLQIIIFLIDATITYYIFSLMNHFFYCCVFGFSNLTRNWNCIACHVRQPENKLMNARLLRRVHWFCKGKSK